MRRAHSLMAVSSCWMSATLIMLVLPVPDCACAMTSRPPVMGRIARCWMADGFSKPALYRTATGQSFSLDRARRGREGGRRVEPAPCKRCILACM